MSATRPLTNLPATELLPEYTSQVDMPTWKVEKHYKDVLAHRGNEFDVVSRLDQLMEKLRKKVIPRKPLSSFMWSYMTSEKMLKYAWEKLSEHGGKSPGPDGIRYNDLDHCTLWETMRILSWELQTNRYLRRAERVSHQPKSTNGFRPIVLQSILDRTVDKAAAIVIGTCCEQFFLPVSYAYRRGICTHDALRQALRVASSKGLYNWLTVDLQDAFSHVPIPRLLDIFGKYFPNKKLQSYVRSLLVDAPVNGLRQGSPLSPVLLNLYLHHHLDKEWAKKKGQRLLRWADDILIMCSTPADAKSAYDQLEHLLTPTGMCIKESKAEAVRDLSWGVPANWLGFVIRRRVVSPTKPRIDLDIPGDAWMSLKMDLQKTHEKPNSALRADDCILGWLNYYAPALRKSMRGEIYEKIAEVAGEVAFDEIQPPQFLHEVMEKLWRKWVVLRDGICYVT